MADLVAQMKQVFDTDDVERFTLFYNVTISVEAANPKAAYDKLCTLLGGDPHVDWETDGYRVYENMHCIHDGDTSELYQGEDLCPH